MKKELDTKEINTVFLEYKRAVNMTYSQMKKWADNPWSRKASLTRGPVKRNLRLLSKPKSDWTRKDIRDAKKTIAFNSRMKKVSQGKPVRKDVPLSKRDISLRNWAWNTNKKIPF
ncbi:MAG: hypothetical protein KC506_02335 [Nanoarchaeota archaeon]|nr:hypothetical protein [Nanoarchaeota archaeon]